MNETRKQTGRPTLVLVFLDLLALNLAFFLMNLLKRGSLILPSDYFLLLLFFNLSWLVISLSVRKFRPVQSLDYPGTIWMLIRSNIYLAYSVSFVVVALNYSHLSRAHIFGACLIYLVLEVTLFSAERLRLRYGRTSVASSAPRRQERHALSRTIVMTDFLLMGVALLVFSFIEAGGLRLPPDGERLLVIVYGLWFITAVVTHKFDKRNLQNYFYLLTACLKSLVVMVLTISVIIFIFRLFVFSRLIVFGSLGTLFILEVLFYLFYFLLLFRNYKEKDVESVEDMSDYVEQINLPIEVPAGPASPQPSFMKILIEHVLAHSAGLKEFIEPRINLSAIDPAQIVISNSPDDTILKSQKKESVRLLIDMNDTSDVRWINRRFLDAHRVLKNGGYFVGRACTLHIHKRRFFDRFPAVWAHILYFGHFLVHRVVPKLPRIRRIYFSLTKGRNRMISRAELLGRLYFCGYKVLAEREIREMHYFVARKTKTPSHDRNPSYGLIVQLRRIGYQGLPITVYKFRTMYPYSEYLQEYIYQLNNLSEGGKIRQDFRITGWGNVLRRYWVDELPMIYNWIKGDLKLFGVRPISRQYLSLYDDQLRQLRELVKPGLIPPYYADLPKRISEINDSEKRYILQYMRNPFKTQTVYFWNALRNILFKGARSS